MKYDKMAKRDKRKVSLGRLRRASTDDVTEIEALLNSTNVKMFHCEGIGDTMDLIKTCVLSICQLDQEENLIGFLALTDHPRISHIHSSAWEKYLWARYKMSDLNARNTLFIHLLCWCPTLPAKPVASNMLRSVFMNDPYLHYLCIIKQQPEVMQMDPVDASVESMFKRPPLAQSVHGYSNQKLPALMTLARPDICPRLRIRRAVEEDNDDLVPLLDAQSTQLRELYGDFYISELVSRHPESERVLLVAEKNELAVGVMVLNTQIDYEVLQDSFELSPFHGLKRSAASEALASRLHFHFDAEVKPREPGDLSTCLNICSRGLGHSTVCSSVSSNEGKDNGFPEGASVQQLELRPLLSGINRSEPQWNYFSLLDEEQDQDFDIVNIEGGLLHVPSIFPCESDTHSPADSRHSRENEDDGHHAGEKRADASSKCKPKHEVSSSRGHTETRMPYRKFTGKPDAFIIEIFAMDPDCDERHGFDILEVSFELFPDRCYCVLALPSDHIAYPLLEHFTLATPHPSRNHLIDQSLYVAHRNSVRGKISVRAAEVSDLVVADKLLKVSVRKKEIFEIFEASLTSKYIRSYMLLSENLPVGFVILGPLEEDKKLHSQYVACPGDIVQGLSSGVVTEALLAPALEPHARWFCRELLRHEEYDELFWTCGLVKIGNQMPCKNLISLTGQMVPLLPRRSVPELGAAASVMDENKHADAFGVWHLSRPLTSLPKVDINHSIVVVGASNTGLSFIETLLFGPSSSYLSLTNVTLVSTQGLQIAKSQQREAYTFIPQNGRYDEAYFKRVPFFFYLDIVEGTMVEIDRKRKRIILQDGGVKYYDDLYLTCGLQFQHPHHLREELEREARMQQGQPCSHSPMDDPNYSAGALPTAPALPVNMMLINSVVDGQKALKLLPSLLHFVHCSYEDHHWGAVVVYGACVEALTCITALLETGLCPSRINYVEPFPPTDAAALRVQHFNDEVVDYRVQATLEATGVTCYRGYTLIGWSLGNRDRVRNLTFLSTHHTFDMLCVALFYYGGKSIDLHAFAALNSSGLVYDGGLVVDPQFGTNDPHIFAAGPGTHYSRILHADLFVHGHYRSEDVGTALGEMALSRLDPFYCKVQHGGPKGDSASAMWRLAATSEGTFQSDDFTVRSGGSKIIKFRPQSVPKFKSCIMCRCVLPGGLRYLHIRRPGPEVPAAIALSLDDHVKGHTLTTDKNGNYFCMKLDTHHIVYELTCLSEVQFHADTLAQLFGKHEQMFNNLLLRYEAGMIEDLYVYFSSPWLTAVYRDDFADLLVDIENHHDVIIGEDSLGTLRDIVTKYADYYQTSIASIIEKTKGFTEKALVEMLAEWLRIRRLPLYALPPLPAVDLQRDTSSVSLSE